MKTDTFYQMEHAINQKNINFQGIILLIRKFIKTFAIESQPDRLLQHIVTQENLN